MYGGTTLNQQPGMGMGGATAAAASPIPQQWWEQDRNKRGGAGGPGPPGNGMSAMDAAVANNSYRGSSPSMSQRFHNLHMGGNSNSNRAMGSTSGDYPPSPGPGHGYGYHNNSQYNNSPMYGNPYPHHNSLSPGPAPGPSPPGAMPMHGSPPPPPGTPRGPSANGLIRLTLKKPMGIVFEPMEDPHNPSQQRGVRVCDLPRTGAAAMSGMLEVGDELLSINNKPMSRLTFDEIMDFIIDADAEHVDLLFRRPKKDKLANGGRGSAHDSGGASRTSNIKWKDVNVEREVIVTDNDDGTVEDSPPRNGKKGSGRYGSPGRRDEESIYSADDTFYTEQTSFTEETRKSRRRGKRRNRRYESESFLDMLIDTVCAPVMGGGNDKRGDYSDDDMTFNSADDGTYASLDESYHTLEEKKRKWQESKRKRHERERKSLEEERKRNEQRERDRERSRSSPDRGRDRKNDRESNPDAGVGDVPNDHHDPYGKNVHNPYSQENDVEYVDQQKPELLNVPDQNVDPSGVGIPPESPKGRTMSDSRSPRNRAHGHAHQANPIGIPPSPPRLKAQNSPMKNHKMSSSSPSKDKHRLKPSDRFEPQPTQQGLEDINDDSLEQDPNIPFKEIEYDDNIDGEVSVMESVGGPSLLLENLRNAAKMERTVSDDIIANFGKDFKPQLGLTREETIQMNPDEFYRYVVKTMLEENEPEKVRLIDKLFAKYGGREEHLIRKLDARYVKPSSKDSENKSSEASEGGAAYEGFKAFGGGGDFSSGEKSDPDGFGGGGGNAWNEVPNFENSRGGPSGGMGMNNNGFGGGNGVVINPPNQGFNEERQFEDQNQDPGDMGSHSSYSEESDYGSVDGTSPEVIAQVSELLNYVYGKTTVAGQIDRVSTIMRAYEGREAVLLELLETKALLKANSEKGGLDGLPESLRDNPGLQQPQDVEVKQDERHGMSPISNMTGPSGQASSISVHSGGNNSLGQSVGQSTAVQSMGQASSIGQQHSISLTNSNRTPQTGSGDSDNPFDLDNQNPAPPLTYGEGKKKKKGIFGGMFKKKNKQGAFPTNDGGGKRSRNKKGALLGGER